MRTLTLRGGLLVAAATLLAPIVTAQSIEGRVAAAPDGTVRMSFAAREGVCGNGRNVSINSSRNADWESDCEPGPIRTVLTVAGGKATKVTTYVGGRWRAGTGTVTDLGTVPARDAATYLVALTERGDAGGKDAIFAATLADSADVWPGLLRVARNGALPRETRRNAVFWLGQAAGDAATASLDSIVGDPRGDRDVREAAVFALSQRPRDEGVPALIRVARNDRDPQIRRKALFWLGQSDDPRAVALFEELLTRR